MIKKILTYILTITLCIQSVFVLGLINPQKAFASNLGDPDKVVINEFQASATYGKFVEIYNANEETTDSIDISGWFISDFSNPPANKYVVPDNTLLAPGQFYVFNNVSWLNGDGDMFQLAKSDSTVIADNQITYGTNPFTRLMPSPDSSKNLSAGRICDGVGAWYVDLTPTKDGPNQIDNPDNPGSNINPNSSLPYDVNSAVIAATSSNPANYINSTSKINVSVEINLASAITQENPMSLNAYLTDNLGYLASLVNSHDAVSGQTNQTLSGINASSLANSLNEGDILPWIVVTNKTSGIKSWYNQGTPGTKDTSAPSQPTGSEVKSTTNNATNVINLDNKTNVSVNIILPSSTSDVITAQLNDPDNNVISANTSGTNSSGVATITGINATNLHDGTITLKSKVTDKAGNSTDWFTGSPVNKDTLAPTGSVVINNDASVTNSYLATLKFTYLDSDSLVITRLTAINKEMMISNNSDFSDAAWEAFTSTKDWSLTNGSGTKTVFVKFKDESGNVSQSYSDSIKVDLNTSQVLTNEITSGAQTITPMPSVELNLTGLAVTTLTTASYNQNPGAVLPSGISGIGKYFELNISSSSSVSWPIMVKLYYTLTDLTNAGISSENQLLGLYYWDTNSSTWKLYSQTGVNTNDVAVGGINYAGYVWANADHFTPVTIGADTTSPQKPANFTANPSDGEINLSWDKVSDAQGYYVRYREGTSVDNKAYSTIYLSGNGTLSTKATGLKNGTLYEFGLQTVDQVGNKSEWAVVVTSPLSSTTITEATITTTKSISSTSTSSQEKLDEKIGSTEISTVGPEDGKIKSESTEREGNSKFWVTLLVIVIALGAGYGGYYGYQWWTKPDKDKGVPKPKEKVEEKQEKIEKTGRW